MSCFSALVALSTRLRDVHPELKGGGPSVWTKICLRDAEIEARLRGAHGCAFLDGAVKCQHARAMLRRVESMRELVPDMLELEDCPPKDWIECNREHARLNADRAEAMAVVGGC
jgi:hypothetical protein